MEYLVLMTLTGSALYAGYLAWERYCRKQLTQFMKYGALWIVLLSYTVPWAWLRGPYSSLARLILGPVSRSRMPLGYADIRAGGAAYRTAGYWHIVLFISVWVGGAAWQMARKLMSYLRCRHRLLASAEECRDDAVERAVLRLKKELHWKGRLRIIRSQRNSSITIGALRPVIFLQDYSTEEELEWILRHEMTHIVRGDLLWKLAAEMMQCLHWFNPVARRAMDDLCQMCETSCDERVLKNRSPQEREFYCRLVARSMSRNESAVPFSSALGSSQKNAKERIVLIMTKGKISRGKKIAAGSLFAVMTLASTLTAFAYPHVYQVEGTAVEAAADAAMGKACWSADGGESTGEVNPDMIIYDEQFIDETGAVYPAGKNARKICLFGHDKVDGYYQTHVKDDNGGCTVKSYESTRCIRCDTIWVGDLYSTSTYVKCPH